MKKFMAVFLVAILSIVLAVSASAQSVSDYETDFRSKDLNDLVEISEVLNKVINEKRLENASLKLNPSEMKIAVGKDEKVDLLPEGREIDDKAVVTYSSADESIASIKDGTVTGSGVGKTEIKVSVLFEDGAVLEASADVEVFTPITAITIPATLTALINQDTDLKEIITVKPETASYELLQYSVDDPSLATVDDNGILKGLKGGQIQLTVTSKGSDKPVSGKCKISINEPVTSISLNMTEFNVGKKNKQSLTAEVLPESASDKGVIWSSDDTSIATVTAAGVVTGVSSGTTTIKCTAKDGSGISAAAKVTVITAVSAIKINNKAMDLMEKTSIAAPVTIVPEDATDKRIKWESDDTSIATVDSEGNITGVAKGKAKITGTAEDGSGVNVSFTVYVEPENPIHVESIFWENVWGEKSGRMGIEALNRCQHRKVKGFAYTIRCQSAYTKDIAETSAYFDTALAPGIMKEGKMSKQVVSGFINAGKVEITVTSVTFADGTVYEIPKDVLEHLVFAL